VASGTADRHDDAPDDHTLYKDIFPHPGPGAGRGRL